MIENLLFLTAINAPEIGSALVKYLADSLTDVVADGAKKAADGVLDSVRQSLPVGDFRQFADSVQSAVGQAVDLEQRVDDALSAALSKFNLVLVSQEELATLRQAAAEVERNAVLTDEQLQSAYDEGIAGFTAARTRGVTALLQDEGALNDLQNAYARGWNAAWCAANKQD